MLWAATEGARFRLRDGKGLKDPMIEVGPAPKPFSKLDESELKRLGGNAIVVLKTAAEAREHEAKMKRAAVAQGAPSSRVRIKTGEHNARLWARRKGLGRREEEAVGAVARQLMTADAEIGWQEATKKALEVVEERLLAEKNARREEKLAKAAELPKPPARGKGRVKADEDDEDGEEEGSSDAS